MLIQGLSLYCRFTILPKIPSGSIKGSSSVGSFGSRVAVNVIRAENDPVDVPRCTPDAFAGVRVVVGQASGTKVT